MFECKLRAEASLTPIGFPDADELFALTNANRARLREWLPWLDYNRTVEDTRAFIKSCLQQSADNKGFQAAIRWNGRIVGMVGYHPIDWANRAVGLGYWIEASAEGRGLVTAASRRLVSYAFDVLGLNRIEIRCATGNEKSLRVPIRLGFTREGVLRQAECLYGTYVDHVVFSMLGSDHRAPAT
jgi:ribosomal-protein-serine acetyltransferase